jgi:type I restriction enzyme R subunit
MDDGEVIADYVRSLEAGKPLDQIAVPHRVPAVQGERDDREVAATAEKHGLAPEPLQQFVDRILQPPMIFDAERLNDLLAPLDLGWRARSERELALMADLVGLLRKRAAGRDISGLSAYEG